MEPETKPCVRPRPAIDTSRPPTHGSVCGSRLRTASTDPNPSVPRSDCKDTMRDLNRRLAGFIEKVHQLEIHNQLLDREVRDIRGRAQARLEERYGAELRRLRELVQEISHHKHQMEIGHHNLEDELSGLMRRFDQEAQGRSEAERKIQVLQTDIKEAIQAKLHLGKRVQGLMDEIDSLKQLQQAEVCEMLGQIQNSGDEGSRNRSVHLDFTVALQDIRAQVEGPTVASPQHSHSFPSQLEKLTEAAKIKEEVLRATQQEIQGYRRQVQAMDVTLDTAKTTREVLEMQLHDVEDRHAEEALHYQSAVKELEDELANCNTELSGYLREYQELLNVKMALDVEILSYRNLLCGEEAQLSSMTARSTSLPYIYHQSPIYALPCHSRTGGPHRLLEPHYKFVEEIITETTREIEMSEYEETESDETENGKDRVKWAKRDTEVITKGSRLTIDCRGGQRGQPDVSTFMER